MSVSNKEISTVGGSGGGGGSGNGGDDEEDESGGVQERDDQRRKKKAKGYGCNGFSRNFGKAKNLVLFPFNRAQKKFSTKPHINSSSSVAAPSVSSSSGKGCCFCLKKSQSVESSMRSQSSDPNDPTFTYDMLRVLIERNDFYSKERNPYLDSQVSCCSD